MVKKLTNKMLGIVTLLMMLMMTSLSAHAVSYYLAGDFTNWENGKIEMASDGQGQWVVPAQAVTAGQQFKIIKVDGETTTWYGYNNYHVSSNVVLNGTTIDVYTYNGNLDFQISGIFRFVLTENGDHPSLVISYVPQPVTVKSGIVNGTLEVDKTQALPGETITITATPDPGYYIEVGNITVEKTINGGSAQVPGLRANPGVGQFVENIQEGTEANTFTFVMPERPYGAQVSAEFQKGTLITAEMIQPIGDQVYDNGNAITPAIIVKDGETTLVEGTDYIVVYSDNTNVGQATVTVTGKGKYYGDAIAHFNIVLGAHNVVVTNDGNGSVGVSPEGAIEPNTLVTLTVVPNEGYELDKLTVDGVDKTSEVANNTYTFTMPDADVVVNATFTKVPALYLTGTFNNWSQEEENMLALQKNDDGKWVCTQQMGAGDTFKFKDENLSWIGADSNGDCVVQYEYVKNGSPLNMKSPGENFKIPVAGTWTFTVDRDANPMTVTISGDWYFNITVQTPTNGSVTVKDDKTKALEGDEVELIITPVAGYQVGTITVKDANNNPVTVTNNKFTMPAADVTVTVNFQAKTYNITVAESTNGKVTAPASATYGSTVTITVEPDEDCVLESLTVTYGENNTPVEVTKNEETGNYTFAMPAGDVTVTATFRALTVTYWVAYGVTDPTINDWGTTKTYVQMNESGNNYVLESQNMAAKTEFKIVKKVQDGNNTPAETWYGASTNDGTMFWITAEELGENIELFPNGNYVNLYFPNDGTYTFTFTPSSKTLVVTGAFDYNITYVNGEHGTVTGPAKSKAGVTVELTVTPENGYRIDELYYMDGDTRVDIEGTSFTMPAKDITINASFTKILTNNALTWNVVNASLEVKVGEGEAATPIQSGTEVQEGSEVNVTITQTDAQAAEWTISKVTIVYGTTTTEITAVDGVYTFEMPAAATEIKVEFTAVKHNITVTPNDYVTVVVDPTTAAAGDEVTITVTPNDDFVVTGVTVNDGDVEVTDNGDGTYTFDMPTGANGVTIDVTVAAKIQGVSFTADRNWATYIGAYDLAKPAGVEAIYVVTGVQSNAVVIEEVNYIPANKGVLLFSETAGENLVAELYTGDKDATISTKLVGNATAATNVTIEDYVLYNNNFIRSEAGTVAAHRCYLPATQVAGAPRILKIGYDGDVPTAIETLIAEGNVAKVMYVNMSGLTSDKPFHGINIAVVTFTDGTTRTVKVVK